MSSTEILIFPTVKTKQSHNPDLQNY